MKIKTIIAVQRLVSSYKRLIFKFDKIVAVSSTVKKTKLQYFHVAADNIVTFNNCIMPPNNTDTNKIEKLTKELNLKENDILILFLGRINNIKGVDILI